ncbi:F-box/WD repeat-containing protein 7-like [Palaemon carinicauda]|uniref:F-box/WD repeat-containing protein 7-like n=1 Tax=Palaemon carinicauda TaxID=392227 RepID=UPI0035B5CCFC
MMGDRVVDINVATVEELETLVGVGRAKAEAIVTTRTSVVEFNNIDDLLLVPGIGKSLLEQNRGVLVCSVPGGAPVTRHNTYRRSLRRASQDVRLRGDLGKIEDNSGEGLGNLTVCASGQAVKPTRICARELSLSESTDCVVEQPCVTQGVIIKTEQNSKDNVKLDVKTEKNRVDELKNKVEDDVVQEDDTSDFCDCCLEDLNEQDDGDEDDFIDVRLLEHDGNQDNEDESVVIMNSDELVNTGPVVKVNSDSHLYHNNSARSDHTCSGSVVSGGLGTDTPHEDVPPELPIKIQALASQQLTDGEDSEEEDFEGEELDKEEEGQMEEGGAEDDSDDYMTVDPPTSPHTDKKQIKRKSEVCSDTKGVCPVKKSCKAVESGGESSRRKVCGLAAHKVSPPPAGLKSWLAKYQTWSPAQKLHALDSLIDVCDLNQVRHIHQIILPQFQRDFISLLPKELALYVLGFLPPKDLLRAAQTCKYWNILAADNLLWREKCREAGIDDHMIIMDRRRRKGTSVSHVSPFKAAFMRQHRIEMNWRLTPLRPPRVLKGHDDHVITCLQFSGNTIVSGSDDNTLKVWNATSGKCMRTLTGHTGGVWSSQMSDNLIVSGSTDRMLRVWNAETGDCIHTLYGHTSTVRCLHLHGSKVVSGSRDATLRVWDVTSGACEHVLVGHVAAVRCVQYNGRLVVSGAYDYMVKVWNPDREECLHTLQGHTNRVYSLQFDGLHVVSGSLDTSIRVWDVETGQCRHTLMGHQSLTSGMELKNNILISGNADSTVKVWDIVSGQCLQTLSGPNKHRSAVTCLQFNNKFVVTSSDDGTVKLWDVRTGEFIRNLVALESGGSGGVVWRIRASDTKLVCAVGSRNGTEETKLLVLDFDVAENLK